MWYRTYYVGMPVIAYKSLRLSLLMLMSPLNTDESPHFSTSGQKSAVTDIFHSAKDRSGFMINFESRKPGLLLS
jgi:hypothetical protein